MSNGILITLATNVCVCVCVDDNYAYHNMHVEIKGQYLGGSFLLPPCFETGIVLFLSLNYVFQASWSSDFWVVLHLYLTTSQ